MNIEKIRQLFATHKIEWTLHAAKRLMQRSISSNDIESSVLNGVIIEDYPNDYPYPSCLVMGKTTKGRVLHTVCAVDSEKVWIITAYEPNLNEWEADFIIRKEEA